MGLCDGQTGIDGCRGKPTAEERQEIEWERIGEEEKKNHSEVVVCVRERNRPNEMRRSRAAFTLWPKKAKPAGMVRRWSTATTNYHGGFRKQDVRLFHAHPCN